MKNTAFTLSLVLLTLCLSSNANAQRPGAGRPEKNDRQASDLRAKGEADQRRGQPKAEKLNRKQLRFQEKHRRYLDDAGLPENRVYRKSKENSEIPKNRYEDFEQKRGRHREYNQYLEHKNSESPMDWMRENKGGELGPE